MPLQFHVYRIYAIFYLCLVQGPLSGTYLYGNVRRRQVPASFRQIEPACGALPRRARVAVGALCAAMASQLRRRARASLTCSAAFSTHTLLGCFHTLHGVPVPLLLLYCILLFFLGRNKQAAKVLERALRRPST